MCAGCRTASARSGERDNPGPLFGEKRIAQPAVILIAGIDDPAHRLVRHLADGGRDLLGAQVAGAGVDQDHALGRDNETEIGIEPVVVGATLTERTDQGVDAVDDMFGLELESLGNRHHQGEHDEQGCEQRTHAQQTPISGDSRHGKPRIAG